MRLFIVVALTFSLVSTINGFCGTDAGSKAERDEVQRLLLSLPQSKFDVTNRTHSKSSAFTIPVVWNVFYDENNTVDGSVSDDVIHQTHDVINSFFIQAGLDFSVQKIKNIPTSYDTLHGVALGNAAEAEIKQHREGVIQTLNIYTVGDKSGSDVLGWATFPWDYERESQTDGIVVDYNTLPGGSYTRYNSGKTLVHEIGHWVGLLHTFQDGCEGGDDVDDTPAEASPEFKCETGRDTCPNDPGVDPIDNLMDYSDEACQKRFTDGQYNRLAQVLSRYRQINLY